MLVTVIVCLFTYKYLVYRRHSKPSLDPIHHYFKCSSIEDDKYNISSHQVYHHGDSSDGTCKSFSKLCMIKLFFLFLVLSPLVL